MMKKKLPFTYALHQSQASEVGKYIRKEELTNVKDVAYDNRYEYICPSCGDALTARCIKAGIQYEKQPHFSHQNQTCSEIGMRYQYLMMEIDHTVDWFKARGTISLPLVGNVTFKPKHDLPITDIRIQPSVVLDGTELMADIGITAGGHDFLVELNATDATKRTIYANSQVPVIRCFDGEVFPYHYGLKEDLLKNMFGEVVYKRPQKPVHKVEEAKPHKHTGIIPMLAEALLSVPNDIATKAIELLTDASTVTQKNISTRIKFLTQRSKGYDTLLTTIEKQLKV